MHWPNRDRLQQSTMFQGFLIELRTEIVIQNTEISKVHFQKWFFYHQNLQASTTIFKVMTFINWPMVHSQIISHCLWHDLKFTVQNQLCWILSLRRIQNCTNQWIYNSNNYTKSNTLEFRIRNFEAINSERRAMSEPQAGGSSFLGEILIFLPQKLSTITNDL